MCETKKELYLQKLNYYNSLNDVYKINKYNYKYQQLLQGGNLTSDQKNKIINKALEIEKNNGYTIANITKETNNSLTMQLKPSSNNNNRRKSITCTINNNNITC